MGLDTPLTEETRAYVREQAAEILRLHDRLPIVSEINEYEYGEAFARFVEFYCDHHEVVQDHGALNFPHYAEIAGRTRFVHCPNSKAQLLLGRDSWGQVDDETKQGLPVPYFIHDDFEFVYMLSHCDVERMEDIMKLFVLRPPVDLEPFFEAITMDDIPDAAQLLSKMPHWCFLLNSVEELYREVRGIPSGAVIAPAPAQLQ